NKLERHVSDGRRAVGVEMSDEPLGREAKHDAPAVLIVEDQDALRRALSRALRRMGVNVVEASDGNQAMTLLSEARFHVIVSDISLPGTSGLELLRDVRRQDLDVPVVLMTGAPDIATAMTAINYGAFKYLAKPIQLTEFESLVRHAVQAHRLARMKREA